MKTIQNMREITIEAILSGGKTREEIKRSIDYLILNVKCNMLCEEMIRKTNEIEKNSKALWALKKF